VLVAAGYADTGVTNSAELFNPTNGTWTMTGALTNARYSHTATLLPNGKVLVAGGYGVDYLSSAEVYNPTNGTWTITGGLTNARSDHTATLLPGGKVLAVGGSGPNPLASAEMYDQATGTWTLTNSLMTARYFHTATLLSNGLLLIAGGYGSTNVLASAELFDPAASPGMVFLMNAKQLPGGAFQFGFAGKPGVTNTILIMTNPSAPLSNWTALGVAAETAAGQFQFTDPQATNNARRFYRIRSQ